MRWPSKQQEAEDSNPQQAGETSRGEGGRRKRIHCIYIDMLAGIYLYKNTAYSRQKVMVYREKEKEHYV
jgi:hypothetical protein